MTLHAPTHAAVSLSRSEVRHLLRMANSDLSLPLRRKAGLCLLDHIACCMAAQNLPWAANVTRFAHRSSTAPEALHWGSRRRIAATEAAFVNGLLGHWLIQDDMHVPSGAHIGVVVLPALLALAQREGLSGRALLTGIVAGYDATARIGQALRLGVVNRHLRPSGLSGAYGAAAGAIAALALDEDIAVNALGFAGNFACGLNEWPWSGGQEIYVHAGTAARHGLVAVDLARAGFGASEAILEGRDGMFAAYGSGTQTAEAVRPGPDAGRAILDVRHKAFPGCSLIQSPIGAALALRERNPLRPAEITSITIRTLAAAQRYPGCDSVGPFTSIVQAKMSLQCGVSAALLHGRVDEDAFARFADPEMARLVARCHVETDAAFDDCYPASQPAEVVVRLADGRSVTGSVEDVPWLDAEAVERRFQMAARDHVSADDAARMKSMVYGLADTADLTLFFEALAMMSLKDEPRPTTMTSPADPARLMKTA